MGKSIIYVGSRDLDRSERYFEKDNFGVKNYRNTTLKYETKFYRELCAIAKNKKLVNPKKRLEESQRLVEKYGTIEIQRNEILSVFCAYEKSINEGNSIHKNENIRKSLRTNLKRFGVKFSIQKKIFMYEEAFGKQEVKDACKVDFDHLCLELSKLGKRNISKKNGKNLLWKYWTL